MDRTVSDPTVSVHYSTDRWIVEQIPLALWFVVAGLAVVLNVDGSAGASAATALVYLVLLSVAFAGWAATKIADRTYGFLTSSILGFVIALAVVVVIAGVAGTVGRGPPGSAMWWSRLVDPPLDVFGWMLMYLGTAFMIFAIYRHAYPGAPAITLSPDGVSIHRSWLKDVSIPWTEIVRAGPLDMAGDGQPARINPYDTVAVVAQEYYARAIAPKRSFFAPHGAESMFRLKDGQVQVLLNSPDVLVAPEQLQKPLDARWRAFHAADPARGVIAPSTTGPVVLGRWSFDGGLWQTAKWAAPCIGLAIVLAHAMALLTV